METKAWRELDLIGFDTETTGKYPLSAEVCELAAVKWRDGQIVDRFSTLLKPSRPMDAEVIAIHGISNAMVEDAPRMAEKIAAFHRFIRGGIVIAHHAPFDLGFMALEFEKAGLSLPLEPALCSSLLSRKIFPESTNHRLQTLVSFFGLAKGVAHRAEDDARACLEVALRCLEKCDESCAGASPLSEVFKYQGGSLTWQRFSMAALHARPEVKVLIDAVIEEKITEIVYSGGSKPNEPRRLHPQGIVRSLDGDFLVAYDEAEQKSKRYLLERITAAKLV